jgi:hypothetical protein
MRPAGGVHPAPTEGVAAKAMTEAAGDRFVGSLLAMTDEVEIYLNL